MEDKLMSIDELGSKDSDHAKLSNQVEDVQMSSVQCNSDRKFEVLKSSDMDTEFSALPQALEQNRKDFHRSNGKGMFESVGSVRFETAFMQNSLSRLACEDDDFRIDLHPSHVSQSHFKYSGANFSQTVTATNRLTNIMPVKVEGCIDSFSNGDSHSDTVISEIERRETNEDTLTQIVNSGVSDTHHLEENCRKVVGCIQYTDREVPSNLQQCQRQTDAEHGLKASLEVTAYQLEHKLSSAIEIDCQGQQKFTAETMDKVVCDAVEDCRSDNLNLGEEENVGALMVILDQSHSEPGEKIQIGWEESKQTEAWCPPRSVEIKGTGTLTECKSSTFAIDHEIENESVIATDCESEGENQIANDFESAVESTTHHKIVGESPIATDCESVVEGDIYTEIVHEKLHPTDCQSVVEGNIYPEIVHKSLLATDGEGADESPIATDCESVVEGNIYHEIVHKSLLATDCEAADESPIAIDCESVVEGNIYHGIVRKSLLATDYEGAGEVPITTDCVSAVEGNIYHEIVRKSLLASDCESAVEGYIYHEIVRKSLLASDSESAVESAIGHDIVGDSLMASVAECTSALESNSFTGSERFCESENEALNNLDLSQRHRCDTKVISNNCNDMIGHQNVCRNEIIVELCNQTEEKLTSTAKNETKAYSNCDAGNDFQIEAKAENRAQDRNEIQDEISGDFDNNLNAPTENAFKDDMNGNNNTEIDYKVKHNVETEQINYIQDNRRAGIFVIPFPVLGESAEVAARCQIEQDINLRIEDEAMCGSTDEKTSEEKEEAVMDDIVTDEDQSVVELEHHHESESDNKFDEEVMEENREAFDIPDVSRIENSEYMSMNKIMVNDRNEHGSKTETEIECSDHNENTMKEELSEQIKTEHESHLKTEAYEELEVETSSKIEILVQDEVEKKLEIPQLPVSGHQAGTEQIQLQHDAENKMSERLLIEGESQTQIFFHNQKIMSGNLCEMTNDMIDRKYGNTSEKLVAETGVGEQIDEKEVTCHFENGVGVENEQVIEDNLGVNSYLDLWNEYKGIFQRKDGFRQHGIAETQNETVANGEILNEVFQSGNSTSMVDDAAECVALHNLSDASLSEGLLKNHRTSNINSAETEFNCAPCDESKSRIHEDRRGFTISVDNCSSDIGACIKTSTVHQIAVSQIFFEGNEKHLECGHQFMPPIFTGETKIPDDFLDNNLTQRDAKDIHGDQQSNFTEVQDFYQNPRSVQKEASSLDFLTLSSTVEKSYCDTSNSSSFQAKIVDCQEDIADIDFAEPTSVSDQTFNDKSMGLMKDFGHCGDEISTFSHLDNGLRSNAANLTTDGYFNVPDLEANDEDSVSCNTLSDVLNQTDCSGLAKQINNPQKNSTTRNNVNECISHFTVSQDDESSCSVENACSSENFVLAYPGNPLLLFSSTVDTSYVNRQPDESLWPDFTLRKTESCFSQVSQNTTVRGDELLKCEEPLPERNQEIVVPLKPDNGKHQHELHMAENFDVFAVPQLSTDSCAVYEGRSIEESNAFGEVSDVGVDDRNITQSDFAKRSMNRHQLKQSTQEVPSCYFMEDDPRIPTEKTSTTCISARNFSSEVTSPAEETSHLSMKKNAQEVPSFSFMKDDPQIEKTSATCISARTFSIEDSPPAEEIPICSKRAFEIPSDEQQVPSVESMKHENEMPDISCLSSHLEETLYEEPPAKRRCREVDIGSNFDHEIDRKWSEDKHETNVGDYMLTNLTGGGKERIPLYAWKTLAEPDLEDHTGMAEQSYPISRDTSAMLPLVIPQLSKCQKPLRLGLSRRYRAPTRLHPNYTTAPSSD